MGQPETVRRSDQASHRLPDALAGGRQWRGMDEAWNALSTLLAGIGVWGAAGYGADRLFGTYPVLLIIGVFLGNFAGVYLIYTRYAADSATEPPKPTPRSVAGWSTAMRVAGAKAEPHPPTHELAEWPLLKSLRRQGTEQTNAS